MSTLLTDFNSAVNKLESTGKNWLTFHQRLQIAVRQKKVWKHFDGTSPRPTPADLDAVKAAEQAANVTFTKHRRKGTVAAIWSAITQEFLQKSMLLCANLRTQFLNMRSTPGANLHTELDRLRMRYEELLSLDLKISDAEYTSFIIYFLPEELGSFVLHISATARVARRLQNAAVTPPQMAVPDETPALDADSLIDLVLEEWDCQQSVRACNRKGREAKDAGMATSVFLSEKLKAKGRRGPQKPVGVCWNCGGEGHRKDQCPSPQQDGSKGSAAADSKPNGSKPKVASTNMTQATAAATNAMAATATLDALAGAWFVYALDDTEPACCSSDSEDSLLDLFEEDARSDCTGLTETSAHSMLSLQTVSDSDASVLEVDADDALVPEPVPMASCLRVVARWLDDILVMHEESAAMREMSPDEGPVMYATPTAAAVAAVQSIPVDVYDSGATHHMSPY
ncbi:hypothetical protein IEO21_07129 [Rhodonia placenta]|uniref:CCHC-type domain-containing protein n=1 Tax=Rhodonia placenta TaxID=104341 RepID=A0A8H7U0M4_9APHY|nr:hypothetical protein IEO21_07129 [Postia placenta]